MNYLKIFPLIAVLLFGSACEDFLDTEPITEKVDANYYANAAEANDALVGCYDALQLIWAGGVALPVAADVMSDQCFGGTGAADGDGYPMLDEFDLSRSPADLNMFESNWINYYKGIFRVNSLLKNLGQVDWDGDTEMQKQVEAEAKFLRAFFYFDMVRMFGRVPLLDKPSNENIPQAEADETYKLIADDLIFAANNLKEITYSEIASTEHGHATVWAAKALLARVYLYYTGYYGKTDLVGKVTQAEALAGLEDIIAGSGHDLLDSYSDLWPAAATSAAAAQGMAIAENTYAGETNQEVIFAIKYTYTSDYNGNTDGNHWMVMNGLRNQSWAARGYGMGWGACTVPAEVYSNWDADDERRDASIMAIEEESIDFTKINDTKEYTGYFTKKYTPTCDENGASPVDGYGGVNFMIGQFQDFFVIRYSDVLLMAAELGSANALTYVNDVRERAGLDGLASVDKDAIFEERKHEFAFEGIRYWDMLRYDSSLQYAADAVSYSGTVQTGAVDVQKTISGDNLKATKGLFQIPNNQITLSGGVLTQNTGWE